MRSVRLFFRRRQIPKWDCRLLEETNLHAGGVGAIASASTPIPATIMEINAF